MKIYDISLLIIKNLLNNQCCSCDFFYKNFGINYDTIDYHINLLKSWGIEILKIYKQGYFLKNSIQLISTKYINNNLKNKFGDNKIYFFPILNSTNQYLIDNYEYLKSGDICIAEHQTKGRGKYGRKWYSPFGYNLYFSIYWNFKNNNNNFLQLSLVIAIIIAESLKNLGIKNIKVKWPNDIYLNNKKLAGILIEVINNNLFKSIIIGIGINCKKQKINFDSHKWISLEDAGIKINKNLLISILINRIRKNLIIFEFYGFEYFIQKWIFLNNSFYNKKINLVVGNNIFPGIYKGINSQGLLILENKNKQITFWNVGEIF